MISFLRKIFSSIIGAVAGAISFFIPTREWRWIALIVCGVFVGLGCYTAHISKATSYLSEDPRACINCHVMIPQYASWKRSSHSRVAVCMDCHVPHDSIIRKYEFKAKDGLRHATIFTLRKEPQVIMIKEEGTAVVQENCIRCHQNVLQDTSLPQATYEAHQQGEGKLCWECHREVPHGRTHSLSSAPYAHLPETEDNVPEWLRTFVPAVEKYRDYKKQGDRHE